MRLLRLALGIMIFIQGVNSHDLLFIITGVLFSLMPLFNIGCCAVGNCSVSGQKKINSQSTEEPGYEEIK